MYPKILRATKEVSGNWRILNKYYKIYSSPKNHFKQMRLKICAKQMRILIKFKTTKKNIKCHLCDLSYT